jgi:serine protease
MDQQSHVPAQPGRRIPRLSVPGSAVRRLGARVLDPATATRVGDQAPPDPTAYVADCLLIRGMPDRSALSPISALQEMLKGRYLVEERRERSLGDLMARLEVTDELDRHGSTSVRIIPDPDKAVEPADAWAILQDFRARHSGLAR